jgi:ABC-2 type transport system permease protein
MLLLSLPLAGVYIGGVAAVYPTASARAVIAASILASPAQRALYGNVYNDTLGAVGIWKYSPSSDIPAPRRRPAAAS